MTRMQTNTPQDRASRLYTDLPLTEKTFLKRVGRGDYAPFRFANHLTASTGWYHFILNGRAVGVVVYAGGRRLCFHGCDFPISDPERDKKLVDEAYACYYVSAVLRPHCPITYRLYRRFLRRCVNFNQTHQKGWEMQHALRTARDVLAAMEAA